MSKGFRRAQSDIERVDLDNLVRGDYLNTKLTKQQDQITGNERALAASLVVNELKDKIVSCQCIFIDITISRVHYQSDIFG